MSVVQALQSRIGPRLMLAAAMTVTGLASAASLESPSEMPVAEGIQAVRLIEQVGIPMGLLLGLVYLLWRSAQSAGRALLPLVQRITHSHQRLVDTCSEQLKLMERNERTQSEVLKTISVTLARIEARGCAHPQCFLRGEIREPK